MTEFLKRDGLPALAYHKYEGQKPLTVMFLGGFRSDMEGTKALFLQEYCQSLGISYLRFDYRGHGQSEGVFEESVLSDWLKDASDMLAQKTDGAVILVGSSMGGWLSFLLTLQNPERVKGVIGLAAAPDFTTWMEAAMTEVQKQTMAEQCSIALENDYSDEPYIITKALLDDGRRLCLLDKNQDFPVPYTLIQGKQDADVPWETAEAIEKSLNHAQAQTIYLEDADHRLSRPQDLEALRKVLEHYL